VSRRGTFVALALAACSSAEKVAPSNSASSIDAGDVSCANDPRAEAYQAKMSARGAAGLLTFVLVSGQPAPPAINDNTWTIQVLDGNGQPVPNATFSPIKTWMPDHGHGSPETPTATANGDGTYAVQPLYFFMNGLWQITFTAQAGSATDSATFSFCIGG
jgi:hypothetical protein